MLDKTTDVQGVGVYVELTRTSGGVAQTAQMFMFPDGYDTSGTLYGITVGRRVVSSESPKKPWRFTALDPNPEGLTLTDDEREAFVEKRMAIPSELFAMYANGGWTMVNQPILIEVSRKDWDDLNEGKTPTKFIYRVTQSRAELGFPADLFPAV